MVENEREVIKLKMIKSNKSVCLDCAHKNICQFYKPKENNYCNHFLSKDAVSAKDIAKKILTDVEEHVGKIYDKHIFGDYDLSDTEKEAVMDFHVDVSGILDRIAEKYIGRRLDDPEL